LLVNCLEAEGFGSRRKGHQMQR